jgi:ABC-type branched-subunit amino acid transport system substrate-binding protein
VGFVLIVALLAACSFPGSVKPTVKVGLSAPFEGLHRDLGYEVLHAVRLAVRQRNAMGGVGERYLVEFVALNDFGEAEAAVEQARKMAVDPGVLGVLGGLSSEAAQAAAPEYARQGLAFLTPEVGVIESGQSLPSETSFSSEYEGLSGGVAPGPAAVWAYSEANRLLDALDAASQAEGMPSRSGVREALDANP